MPKVKENPKPTVKLYHGTTEAIAKAACVKGLLPYELTDFDWGTPRNVRSSSSSGICLTSVYSGLLAFDTAAPRERWGILEIEPSFLHPDLFAPHEGFLVEKSKGKLTSEADRIKKLTQLRQDSIKHRKKWRESLETYGFCIYTQAIPLQAITKVVIYDPQSNLGFTKAITNNLLGTKIHQSNVSRQKMTTRWLMGENVTGTEWIGEDFIKLPHNEQQKITSGLQNKNGLDIYYLNSNVNTKLKSWW